jgi:hypothetical protein
MPPSNFCGYDWLSPNSGNMRAGGSLGEVLLPLSVLLLAVAESPKKPFLIRGVIETRWRCSDAAPKFRWRKRLGCRSWLSVECQ